MTGNEYTRAACAALAFHKALIGLSQLDALEQLPEKTGNFYGPKGIYTYYVAYHLFCACMLIVPEKYDVGQFKSPRRYGEVTDLEIDNPSETPAQWEHGREYETDWATNITHGQVKKFCSRLREVEKEELLKDAPCLIPLYQHFVDDTDAETHCIPALYEKLCYIRDRIIYRPSYVITSSDRVVQTSAQLGQELRSLPGTTDLYRAIHDIYDAMISSMEAELDCGHHGRYMAMFSQMWSGRVDEKDLFELCALGHKKRRLQLLGQREADGTYSYPTYLSHLLEMESIDFVRTYTKKYWNPLEQLYRSSWANWRKLQREREAPYRR